MAKCKCGANIDYETIVYKVYECGTTVRFEPDITIISDECKDRQISTLTTKLEKAEEVSNDLAEEVRRALNDFGYGLAIGPHGRCFYPGETG